MAGELAVKPETHGSVLKLLGLVWRPVPDDFVLRGLLDILKERENTKQIVLQSSACIFDPLGFLNPLHNQDKVLGARDVGERAQVGRGIAP